MLPDNFAFFILHFAFILAGVAELADAPDLGSGGTPVQVQVLSPAPNSRNPIFRVSVIFMYEKIGLEPALGEAEHNRVFA